jgi:acetolactate synthase-1/2/3 large subunit
LSEVTILANEIAAAGVTHVFGITGSGASLLLCDLLERAGIAVIRTQFEGSAAIMAGTVGRITGKPGVVLSIKGPGVANMIPGLAASNFENFPLVAVSEAYPPDSPPSRAHKRLDHATMAAAVTKAVRPLSVRGPGFREAVACATAEVPGPVLLEITGAAIEDSPALPAVAAPAPNAGVFGYIAAAQKPIVIAGTLAVRLGWGEALARLRVPVFTTASAKGLIDETLPHSANVFTFNGLEHTPEAQLLPEADLVVGLGIRPGELLATKPFPCPAINVEAVADIPGADAFKFAAIAAPSQASDIFSELAGKGWGLDRLAAQLKRLDAVMLEGFLPARAFRVLEDHFGRKARLVLDTGYFCTIGEHAIRAARADLCLMAGQGRYMGTGLPMALGAALCDASVPTVAVLGDGGIGMYVGELRLAVERRLPLLVLLMSDGRFGSIATRAIKDRLTQAPITPGDPSWMSVMAGFGLPATRVASDEELRRALAAWNPASGPAYIEAVFSPEPYERMVAGIR